MIYNAPGPGDSDEAWVAEATRNIDAVRTALGGLPDEAVIKSWTKHPSHILPETSPGALADVLREYLARNKH